MAVYVVIFPQWYDYLGLLSMDVAPAGSVVPPRTRRRVVPEAAMECSGPPRVPSFGRGRPRRLLAATASAIAVLVAGGTALGQPLLEEVASGGSLESAFVTTAQDVTAVAQDLYLASVSSKGFQPTVAVNGLGLLWTLVAEQCAGREQTGVSLWMARGVPAASGPVSAQVASAPRSTVISVARYSGANGLDPIGAVASANTNGSQGACVGGIDSAAYSVDLPVTSDGARIFGAVAIRQRDHTPGADYVEIAEVHAGTLGAASGLATQHRTLETAAVVPVDGSLSDTSDWAVVALEIVPGLPAGPCGDEVCSGAETCASCAADCGACAPCVDGDGDLYGASGSPGCPLPGADCNDADPDVFPGAAETLCDGVDSNCNGLADDDANADLDPVSVCSGDCNDADPAVFPGSAEICSDGADNNCNLQIDCADAVCAEVPACVAVPIPALPGGWARLALGIAILVAVRAISRRRSVG